ncbi:MAG TPA: cytochrome c biogenesis protein CcdC [Bacilli bacterium]|nr:cytochrome c biogenesis protein CcdC [Bacilli bacterium]
MNNLNPTTLLFILIFLGLGLWLRTRRMRKPIKGRGIVLLIPVLIFVFLGWTFAMTPGLQITTGEVLAAVGLGLVLSLPMIYTTNYEVREDGQIYAKVSKGFVFSLLGLFIIRFGLRQYLSDLKPEELSMLFFYMAATYITLWRVTSFVKFRKVYQAKINQEKGGAAL